MRRRPRGRSARPVPVARGAMDSLLGLLPTVEGAGGERPMVAAARSGRRGTASHQPRGGKVKAAGRRRTQPPRRSESMGARQRGGSRRLKGGLTGSLSCVAGRGGEHEHQRGRLRLGDDPPSHPRAHAPSLSPAPGTYPRGTWLLPLRHVAYVTRFAVSRTVP